MAYEDYFTTKQTYEGGMARVVFYLNSIPQEERQELLERAMREMDEQYVTAGTKNFTTPTTKKWYAKLLKDWEKAGAKEEVRDVSKDDIEQISFNAEFEQMPMSFLGDGKVLVVGPFWESSINNLY